MSKKEKIRRLAVFIGVPEETIKKYPEIVIKAFEEQFKLSRELLGSLL